MLKARLGGEREGEERMLSLEGCAGRIRKDWEREERRLRSTSRPAVLVISGSFNLADLGSESFVTRRSKERSKTKPRGNPK